MSADTVRSAFGLRQNAGRISEYVAQTSLRGREGAERETKRRTIINRMIRQKMNPSGGTGLARERRRQKEVAVALDSNTNGAGTR